MSRRCCSQAASSSSSTLHRAASLGARERVAWGPPPPTPAGPLGTLEASVSPFLKRRPRERVRKVPSASGAGLWTSTCLLVMRGLQSDGPGEPQGQGQALRPCQQHGSLASSQPDTGQCSPGSRQGLAAPHLQLRCEELAVAAGELVSLLLPESSGHSLGQSGSGSLGGSGQRQPSPSGDPLEHGAIIPAPPNHE